MKVLKSNLPFLFILALVTTATSCMYSSHPPRRSYDYGYRIPPRPPRVIVVRPAPRVVYRHYHAPRAQYNSRNNARRGHQPRSNRNYRRDYSHNGRSYSPR